MSAPLSQAAEREARIGVAALLGAFGAWGLGPLYFRAVDFAPALEVLAHRALWSLVLLLVVLAALGRLRSTVTMLSAPGVLPRMLASTLLISTNWFIFIYAVNTERVLQISLGYYINPLVNVLLGMLVLRERLSLPAALAVGLAATGVANLAWQTSGFPWISLVLGFSFGFYGLVRKLAPVGPLEGLAVETALVTPLALGYLAWMGAAGTGHFAADGLDASLLLMLAGPVTAVPLVLFAVGAKRLRYTVVGFLQYLAPSMQFLLAVLVFDERFDTAQTVTFACIWSALAIFTVDSLRRHRRQARLAAQTPS
jgi:chloramphenicol-sensitive protein RarD